MTVEELASRLLALPPQAVIGAGEATGGGGEIWADDGGQYHHIWTEGPED